MGEKVVDENNEITQRERQILEWIRQNPMISQLELAKLAGISRSGIAAHISNLMKKGYLRGKGYIVSPIEHVTVIGGINTDIYGIASREFMAKTSTPGHVFHAIGGLGRNISLNLRKLGVFNYFISVYGDDLGGEQFKIDATNNDMDITYSKQLMNRKTSSYIYLNQPTGERFVGLDDMGINEMITPEFLKPREDVIQGSTEVVVDTNLPENTIRWICQNFNGPVFAKAVSLSKTERLRSNLHLIDTLVINGIEAPILSGIQPTDKQTAIDCSTKLLRLGVKNVFLYIDSVGMLYQNKDAIQYFPQPSIELTNTNGAGAAATAALVFARQKHKSFKEAAELANAAAYLTSESKSAVNEQLSINALTEQKKRLFY
ncbi:HTH domain protein [Lentilactobacillus hilgardii ATCC 27305]|nr:HTH domain protein [Lentilactobacillus hilgardii ATCC 27305]